MNFLVNQFNSKAIDINSKTLKVPSFFMISNLGGGGSDKYRETVYLDMFKNIPCLYNYHYLTKADFAGRWLKQLYNYTTFADFIDFTRTDMKDVCGYYCEDYNFSPYNAQETIYLLDSGAANIINDMLKECSITSSEEIFLEELLKKMKSYYDFSNRFKFDIVIGFDIGGKYTFKGDERSNTDIIEGNTHIKNNATSINNWLLEETIIYLSSLPNFYPKVFATVHGSTPKEYYENVLYILELEKKFDFKFDGFALGGIASSKSLDKETWGISKEVLTKISSLVSGRAGREEVYNAIIASFACRIVSNVVGNRPIHALGAGGKMNIIPLYYSGATSFDSQTPGRRAYDGNDSSSSLIFNPDSSQSFSKYLLPLIDTNLSFYTNLDAGNYIKLNKVDTTLCTCPICTNYPVPLLKDLYSKKHISNEYYYLSRQLINGHSILQHNLLCDFAHSNSTSSKDPIVINNSDLGAILNYIIYDFDYKI